mmetsp:Transcript_50140/g.83512  ORF Transcript_50140/g.83512 Transcript_50140/m.83512 type:complete len:223 (+) Transcript_50140:378-1046(+)
MLGQWCARVVVDRIKMRDMYMSIAMCTRHVLVDETDTMRRRQQRGACAIHRRAQRAIAVLIRRRCLNQRDIDNKIGVFKQLRNLRQEDRRKICQSHIDIFADITADKQRIVTKMWSIRVVGDKRCGAAQMNMNQLNVAQVVVMRMLAQRLNEYLGCHGRTLNVDALTRFDTLHRVQRSVTANRFFAHNRIKWLVIARQNGIAPVRTLGVPEAVPPAWTTLAL